MFCAKWAVFSDPVTLIKASKQEDFEDEFQVVTNFYKNDFNKELNLLHLVWISIQNYEQIKK